MTMYPFAASCDSVERILQAALELFAENGYKSVSMHAVAERAGCSKANVFHHFASKDRLYLAALRAASREWGDEMGALIDAGADFSSQLRTLIGAILGKLCEQPARSRLMLREILENGALRGRQLTEQTFARNFELEMAIFRRGQAEGDLRADLDPVIAWVMTISACMFFFQSRDVLQYNPEFRYAADPGGYADQICDVLLRGIAAAPTGSPIPGDTAKVTRGE